MIAGYVACVGQCLAWDLCKQVRLCRDRSRVKGGWVAWCQGVYAMTESIPSIRKASIVRGDTLIFRDATPDDAEFILSLRTDAEKSRYLSATTNELGAQRAWLERYASSEGQAYFIIEFNNESIGTVRLYDAQGESFCWGSWILKDGRPRQAAMESALMVYAYAIDHLGFKT